MLQALWLLISTLSNSESRASSFGVWPYFEGVGVRLRIPPLLLLPRSSASAAPLPAGFRRGGSRRWGHWTCPGDCGPCFARNIKKCLHFSICACHPCAGAMLILSASFKFNEWSPKGIRLQPVFCCFGFFLLSCLLIVFVASISYRVSSLAVFITIYMCVIVVFIRSCCAIVSFACRFCYLVVLSCLLCLL